MSIAPYLAQCVWRKAQGGVDEYGQPVVPAAVQTLGRWLEKRRLVRNDQGAQVISEVTVSLGPDEPIAVGDQLSIDNATYLTVIAVSIGRGLAGEAIVTRAYL